MIASLRNDPTGQVSCFMVFWNEPPAWAESTPT